MKKSTAEKYAESLLNQKDMSKGRMRKWDYIIMAAITCIYAVLALTNLGSLNAPHSAWRDQPANQAVTIDLGQSTGISSLWHYDGICKGEIKAQYSNDAQTWTNLPDIVLKEGEMYKWQRVPLNINARYLKLTPGENTLWVNEIALWDNDGKLIQTSAVTPQAAQPLFDEQSIIPAHPTYMNEMYFDEIYHARTALENIERMSPYENTHPPLGKVFIAAGIEIFGMDPFGWRFMGTVFGIFMVPVIYILAKRILRETKYASLATVLFTFDFMHFTQTRIATIDTYGVFFILLMYYFMYRYYEMSFYKEKLGKTLTMLGLCGLMFGLGSACKWIGLYAGAGLAVLFFLTIWRRWREYRYAKDNIADAEGEKKAVMEYAIRVYARYTWITLGCAILFFLIIPALIYYASYFPYMMVKDRPYNFQGILDLQKYMYNYHSTLTERHPYEAAWYMWPVDVRPIWFYYQADTGISGAISSISSFGNPAVWWSGFFAALFCIFSVFRRKGEDRRLLVFVLIALASQFIPWIFITRATFTYHYFASVPFTILLAVYCVRRIERRFPKVRWLTYAFMAIAIVLFALFYPIISGVPAQKSYFSDVLRWFQSWVFYL